MDDRHTPQCFAAHLGIWAVDATFLRSALAAIQSGALQPLAADRTMAGAADYEMDGNIAVIHIEGSMTKGASKFGGASTVATRRALRAAAADKAVAGVMLKIDSPGGTVAGTQQLADDVRAVMRRKPVHTHYDDMGASAAVWVGSQAGRVSANKTAEVGSVGVFAVVYDESEAMDAAGVKVHVISTGEHKGAGAGGAPVTDEQLADFQGRVDAVNEHFHAALKRGRPGVNVSDVSDGRVYTAAAAKGHGLIDSVESYERAMAHLRDAAAAGVSTPLRDRAAARLAIATLD
jgi:signal peptide peptidase SppA